MRGLRSALAALCFVLLPVSVWAQQVGPGMTPTASNAQLPTARRNLHAYPYVAVKDYAVCDNSTDDATALQTAATAAAGGTLGFPDDPNVTCLTSLPITISGNTAVVGSATLKPTTGNVSAVVLLSIGSSHIRVSGITLDGGGKDFGTASNVVQIYGGTGAVDDVVFDGVHFQHTRGTAWLASTNVTNSGVINSYFTDIGNHWKTTALVVDRADAIAFCCGTVANNRGNFATGNFFTDIGLDAVQCGDQHDCLVSENRFFLADGQIYAIWTNPQPTAFGGAVYCTNTDACSVLNNMIEGAQGNAIDTNAAGHRIISNNFVRNSGGNGIGVYASGDLAANGNFVINSGQWSGQAATGNGVAGVSLSGSLGEVSLTGNVSTDDASAISTTCTGTVGVGSTSCAMASVAGMATQDQIKIAGAGVASADLTVYVASISGSVVTWNTATSTSQIAPAVTGVPVQAYGIFGHSGMTATSLSTDDSNALSGNVTSKFGGSLSTYSLLPVARLPNGTTGSGAFVLQTSGALTDSINQEFTVSTSTLTKTNNTTLAVVPGLSVNLTAGATYNCQGHLTGTSGASGGIKVLLVATNSLTATSLSFTGDVWNAGSLIGRGTVTSLASTIIGNTVVYTDIWLTGAIVVNAGGTINVEAAQNASDGTATTVLQNSTFSCVRVS